MSSLLSNYGPRPFAASHGEGSYLFDTEGRRYLDFVSGIAVNTLGHAHPRFVAAISAQVARLTHVSNLYGIPEQDRLATRLAAKAGPGKVLFCNSGAEANEALIKLARLHGRRLSGGTEGVRYGVINAKNAFHGRTFGGMAATPQEKIQGGFRPMLEGFRFAELNNIDSFAALIDASTAAIFVETVQGEGGVFPADPGFLRELRSLCDERDLLLMLDEVQCGIGRSGTFFAFEQAGILPDAIGMAKGLGGGFPIGAIWVAQPYADLFQPGSHGTTFGGSPLACAAAHAILDEFESADLLANVRTLGQVLRSGLESLAERYSDLVAEVRGLGFMLGLGLTGETAFKLRDAALAEGLLTVPAGPRTVRLLPPLTVSESEIHLALDALDRALAALSSASNT